jgi:hypothetical protein
MLGRWRRRGLTGRDFCAQNALSGPSFYAWKREIAQRDLEEKTPVDTTTRASVQPQRAAATLPAFLPVTVDSAGAADALEVVTAAGRVLRVRAGFDAEIEAILNSGESDEQTCMAEIIGIDRDADLAVLRVQGQDLPPPLKIIRADDLEETQEIAPLRYLLVQ